MGDFIKSIKSNPKNAHQFSTVIRSHKEIKVIYTHQHFQEALKEQKIREALEGNKISYQVPKGILEDAEDEKIKHDELISMKM